MLRRRLEGDQRERTLRVQRIMSEEIGIEVSVAAPGWRRLDRSVGAVAEQAARAALRSRSARAALRRLRAPGQAAELAIVLAGDRMVRALNRRYRGIDKPTNVLSFPAHDFAGVARKSAPGQRAPVPLGDVVLAWQTVSREAAEQGKPAMAHLVHLVVHGTLHLLGFDHADAAAARRMEGIEVRVLARLGVADPYRTPPMRRHGALRAA
jgi:probable rRNA maturation factor